jgi:hypothetical protein
LWNLRPRLDALEEQLLCFRGLRLRWKGQTSWTRQKNAQWQTNTDTSHSNRLK